MYKLTVKLDKFEIDNLVGVIQDVYAQYYILFINCLTKNIQVKEEKIPPIEKACDRFFQGWFPNGSHFSSYFSDTDLILLTAAFSLRIKALENMIKHPQYYDTKETLAGLDAARTSYLNLYAKIFNNLEEMEIDKEGEI